MNSIFQKTENLTISPVVLGERILKILQKEKNHKISILSLFDQINKNIKITPKILYEALIFLYTLNLIDFHEPYIVLKNETS
ncbi:hypothetical protein I6M70_03085 [Acinetobacter pittii]|uniref:hypothetical protein n=1 Tax=Acinetobacter pittii TaxID=48296 RepID=UPI000F73D9CE|nr:hypothetical protein [Acinetobacter pittii]MDB0117233.1 hypothetical protein [Acinetobacter baumannii]MBJ8478353.1 hypothetical protein [Acinetobacter pittii]MCH2054661.1 hypothetical protein [Acinetobacter pittii]MCU4339202.1 hypothetical protein [Acinetobacter pittii]MCU4559028.1 hypothetical protein [Acinetobacter pittii]